MSKRAFTLLELIIVIIVIGILAMVGFGQYQKTLEKARWAEAKEVIGQIRKAGWAYYYENGVFPEESDSLMVSVPISPTSYMDCKPTHWFTYLWTGEASGTPRFIIGALRCTSGGKIPDSKSGYAILYIEDIFGVGEWGTTAF